ncbi:MAG: GNAT family N-acetyltransferase [Candidatus Eisenbacteria bacterium]|nr:GNAT family N-acetyltransferase [Candidatus Eisenbacteria bacterium]
MSLGVRCLDAAPREWGALLELDPDATPAHRPEVWSALAAALPAMTPGVIAVEDNGRLIGGAPFVIERRAGLAWIHALPFLLPGAPLALPGQGAAVDLMVADAIATLQRELRTAGGEWACYRASGGAVATHALEIPSGETRWVEAEVIDLSGGIEAARRAMGRKVRQGIARTIREGLLCAAESGALEEAYVLHVRQSRGWSAHRPLPLELSRRLIEANVAQLVTARDRRGLLCAALALEGARETFLWWSGAHEQARRSDAYAALLWWTAERAAERGCARLNLGASRGLIAIDAFKDALGARRVRYPVRWLDARHAPAAGRAIAAIQTWVRRGRSRGDAT